MIGIISKTDIRYHQDIIQPQYDVRIDRGNSFVSPPGRAHCGEARRTPIRTAQPVCDRVQAHVYPGDAGGTGMLKASEADGRSLRSRHPHVYAAESTVAQILTRRPIPVHRRPVLFASCAFLLSVCASDGADGNGRGRKSEETARHIRDTKVSFRIRLSSAFSFIP